MIRDINYTGIHLLIDVTCDKEFTNEQIKEIFKNGVLATGATVLQEYYHDFVPQGCSGIILLAESHASFHTFPEVGLINYDIFTCGKCDTWKFLKVLKDSSLSIKDLKVKEEYRGLFNLK